jgi:hypothetical protein
LRLRWHRQQPPQERVAPLGNLIVVAFLIAHVGEDMPPRDHFKETARHIGEILAETLNASDRIAAIHVPRCLTTYWALLLRGDL